MSTSIESSPAHRIPEIGARFVLRRSRRLPEGKLMMVPRLRRRALVVGLGLAVAASGVGVLSSSGAAGAVTLTNACINDVAPTFGTQDAISLTGDVPASVLPGASFQLTNISLRLGMRGSDFVGGYNGGLLGVGVNTFPGTVTMAIEGTNTVEGTQTTPARAFSVTVTITDPDGVPGTGDETGTDATVTVTYPDQTWTAGAAGAIEFREDTVTPLSVTVGGMLVTLGGAPFVPVSFGCDPGTLDASGLATGITLTDPAPSFASTVSIPFPAGAVTFTNACIDTADPTFGTPLDVSLTGNVPASVLPGAPFQLTNISQRTTAPGSGALFVSLYDSGLLTVGVNTFPGTVKTAIEGTNTVEGTQTTPATAVALISTITDPDGVPATGDESATDGTVTVAYPDQTWTAGPAGPIEFREDTVTPLSPTVGGILETFFGTVNFGCDPGTLDASGLATGITLTDPAPSFASIPVSQPEKPTGTALGEVNARNGYWLVATDGGIFSFGDAAFRGSTGAIDAQQADRRDGLDPVRERLLVGRVRRRDLRLRRRGVPRLDGSDDAQQADRRDGLDPVRERLLVGRVRRRDLRVRRRGVPRLDGCIDAQQADRRDGLDPVRQRLLVGRVRRRDLRLRRRGVPRLDGRIDAQQADRRDGLDPVRARATGWSRPTAGSSPSATRRSSARRAH